MGIPDFSGWTDRADRICAQLEELNTNLREFPKADVQQHSKMLREWERFVLTDGANCSASGGATVGGGGSNLIPAPNGWEAYITSVAVTVSGASSAASVVNYNGEVSDLNLFDYANSMLGSSPSRIVGFYDPETVYCEQADPVNIVIAGAVASSTVIVRVSGKRRQT